MTDPHAGKQPSSGTNRPVPGMGRATGDGPVPSSHWLDASSTKGDTWDRESKFLSFTLEALAFFDNVVFD